MYFGKQNLVHLMTSHARGQMKKKKSLASCTCDRGDAVLGSAQCDAPTARGCSVCFRLNLLGA